jgi:hypothetical protein
MVLVVSILIMAFGLMCLFERDIAFMLYEYDARLMGKVLRRTPDWDSLMRIQGAVLVMAGVLGLILGLR